MTTKTSYVKVQSNIFTPINITVSNTIKCVHCDVYVPSQQLQSHSKIHIPQKYSLAILEENIRNNNIQHKLDIKSFLNQQNDHQDISIKSILPQQMPQVQVIKKQTIKLQSNLHIDSLINYKVFNISQQPDTLSIVPLEASVRYPQIPEERLQLRQKLNFENTNVKMDEKSLKFYRNNNINDGWHEDEIVHCEKKKNQFLDTQQGKQNLNVYVIESIAQKKKKNKNQPFRIYITGDKKKAKHKQKISTISTSGSGGFFKHSNISLQTNTQFRLDLEKVSKFECIECKGFYCKSCGSDIPPIYRPVPNNDRNSEVNQQIKQFLNNQTFYNKSQCKSSRVTGCTNCE